MIRQWLFVFIYRRIAKKTGNRPLCFSCWDELVLEDPYSHSLRIDASTSVRILCTKCHKDSSESKKIWLYGIWFRKFSGLPKWTWKRVQTAVKEESWQ